MELTVELVREWFAANKTQEPVKALLKELGAAPVLTAEVVKPWLETDEGRKLVEPIVDRERTRAVKTHDEKTREEREAAVKKAVEDAVAKANPKETPIEKQLRELQEKDRARDAKEKQLEITVALGDIGRSIGVNPSIVFRDGVMPPSIEVGKTILEAYKADREEYVTKAKNELLATGSHRPGSGNGAGAGKVDLSKMSLSEAIKLEEAGQLNAQLPAR